jgi:hypothetical protein
MFDRQNKIKICTGPSIKILRPSTKHLWKPDQYDVVCYNHFTSVYNDRNNRLLFKFLTLYLCITFHFIVMVIYIIREKGCIVLL